MNDDLLIFDARNHDIARGLAPYKNYHLCG